MDHCAWKPTANRDDDSGRRGSGDGGGGSVAAVAVKQQQRCREIKLSRQRQSLLCSSILSATDPTKVLYNYYY